MRRATGIRNAPAILHLVPLLALLLGCGGVSAPAVTAAEAIPSFRLASIDGGLLGTEDLRGKVVVYDFWATWCGPCHIQAEILHTLFPKVAGRGVEFVAVSVGEPEAVVREFLAERPYPYPVLIDPEDEVSGPLEIIGLPTLIVVDREGRIVFRNTGIVGADDVERALAKAGAA